MTHDHATKVAKAVPVSATARATAHRRHPLLASALALGDNRLDFEAFAEAMMGDLDPQGPVEVTLAARAVGLAWRLNRVQDVESAFVSKPDSHGAHLTPLESALDNKRDIAIVEGISRWEAALERSLFKVLDQLAIRRARRADAQNVAIRAEQSKTV